MVLTFIRTLPVWHREAGHPESSPKTPPPIPWHSHGSRLPDRNGHTPVGAPAWV